MLATIYHVSDVNLGCESRRCFFKESSIVSSSEKLLLDM